MREKICGIYSITNLVNDKRLIGQSTNIHVRWNSHKSLLRKNRHDNPHLQSSWNQYGESNFKFEVILVCALENLDKEEIRFIKEYKTGDKLCGYNLKSGGNRPIFSEETKQKIKWNANHMSETHRRNLSLAQTGNKNHFWGKKLTEEHKKKCSDSLKGRIISEECKRKLSLALKGKPKSEEHRRKISEANSGKHISQEHINKLRAGHKKYFEGRATKLT